MTPIRQSRRDLLKGAAAVAVATSVGLGGATGSRSVYETLKTA